MYNISTYVVSYYASSNVKALAAFVLIFTLL